ncbi:MAG: LysR family transcriptional regulator [Bacteriovoracaceae bacterium]|jgi:DNA-binding transcriptional LysR family regulator|nr:LysR family transcriptional regulator [Bacteriovoracaceae bacterium]
MEINKIKYFRAVYELGSMRKAAEVLSMSAGSLSKSIKSLEQELEVKLFVADGRNIRPSEQAISLYAKSNGLISAYEDFINSKDIFENNDSFKIATYEVFSTYFLSKFCMDYPEFYIDVLEKGPGQLEKSILDGLADFGITYMPVTNPNLEFYKISKFNFNVYTNKKYSSRKAIDIEFAVPIHKIDNSISGITELDNWPVSVKRNIKYRFEMLESALESVRHGQCAIYCPDFIAKLQNKTLKSDYQLRKFESLKLSKTRSADIYIVTRKGFGETKFVKQLARTIRLYC